jgi:S-DNA-T family DNA segregation ATPase FtsK/SpoIIIE
LPQAHRIKTEPPAIRVGILRFAKGVLREISFWLLAAIALGMIGRAGDLQPRRSRLDPYRECEPVSQSRRVIGAWFADVNLYFFGYPAYLLPLGMIFGGWRLFMRGALLELDGEIVLLRVMGFVVTLTMACGLAALHLHPAPGTVPGSGSAGGLVGVHQPIFDPCLRVRGWQPVHAVFVAGRSDPGNGLFLVDAAGWGGSGGAKGGGLDRQTLVMAPLRRTPPDASDHDSENVDPAGEIAPVSAAEAAASGARTNPDRGFRPIIEGPLAWWRAWRTPAASVESAAVAGAADRAPPLIPPSTLSPDSSASAIEAEATAIRHPGRIDPVFNLPPHREPPRPPPSVAEPMRPAPPVWELPAGLRDADPGADGRASQGCRRSDPVGLSSSMDATRRRISMRVKRIVD